MQIIIKEENGFMPATIITIYEDRIELEENRKVRMLKYDVRQIKEIMDTFLMFSRNWEPKYIGKSIIDDEAYTITIVGEKTQTYYIKNKYPQNWSRYILFRNKLVREELK